MCSIFCSQNLQWVILQNTMSFYFLFTEYAVGNFTEELLTTTSLPKSSTGDPLVQVIDVVPHGSGAGKDQNGKGQDRKGQGQDGGEEVNENGEKKGMLGNNPSYGK